MACRRKAAKKTDKPRSMMQTIEVSVDKQQTQDFDEDDVLEEFIEREQHRAAEPDSPRIFSSYRCLNCLASP